MKAITYTDLRENLARYMDQAVNDHDPIIVTRQGKASVVMISLDEFEGWQETVHLLRSPRNAEILLRSIRDADAGHVEEHDLTALPSPKV